LPESPVGRGPGRDPGGDRRDREPVGVLTNPPLNWRRARYTLPETATRAQSLTSVPPEERVRGPAAAQITPPGRAAGGQDRMRTPALRHHLGELAALTALPAAWGGLDRRRLAESLADVVAKVLCPQFLRVRLEAPAGQDPVEVTRPASAAPGPHPDGAAF